MNLSELVTRQAQWLRGQGQASDVVISSRARLARNLAGVPFLSRCADSQLRDIAHSVRDAIGAAELDEPTDYVDIEQAGPLDRQLLVERHLISRQHAEAKGPRGVAVSHSESLAVMVNEEDHLRMQVLRGGLQLDECYARIAELDARLERRLTFAFSSRFGYLTACPTNVGTGLRVSVMLHLPALKMTGQIEKALRAARDMHLAVRGLYGEGTEAVGDFFQVSNQTTLGRSEENILVDFRDRVLPGLVEYERLARQALLRNRRLALEDKVQRAYALLRSARLMSSEEAMYLLSNVRLGTHLGLIEGVRLETVNDLLLLTQPAHLQRLCGRDMEAAQRGAARAQLVRERLSGR